MDMIFSWSNGDTRTYTRSLDLAEAAIKNGRIVKILKQKPFIARF